MRKGIAISLLGASALLGGIAAQAAIVTDAVTVTIGQSSGGLINGFNAGYGSVVPAGTSDGYAYQAIYTNPGRCKPNGCSSGSDQFSVGGFTSDPGQAWLTSVTYYPGCANSGSTAVYTYGNGVATWSWRGGPCDYSTYAANARVNATVTHTLAPGVSGWITPKYQVVGIIYAPPGAKSSVTYANGFSSGTASQSMASFKSGITLTDSVTGGANLFGILDGKSTTTYSAGWTQTMSSSDTVSISEQYSTGLVVPGPPSSGLGVDHDYDSVLVWLNPAVQMTIYGTRAVVINGYNWDARDTVTGMDVIELTIGQLKGTQPMSAATLARLERTWDPLLGALNTADYQAIAATDVFYTTPGFNPNTDTTHRFELPSGVDLILNYVPSGTAVQQTYNSMYTTTTTAGQGATEEYSVGFSIEGGASLTFIAAISGTFKVSSTLTYTNQWSSTVSSGSTQSANFTIVEPVYGDNYTGPTAIQVWKDNVYGTFMFYPEN